MGTTTASAWKSWTAAFIERPRELGWIEGSNVAIEYRWAEARNERFAVIASGFVRLTVDVSHRWKRGARSQADDLSDPDYLRARGRSSSRGCIQQD